MGTVLRATTAPCLGSQRRSVVGCAVQVCLANRVCVSFGVCSWGDDLCDGCVTHVYCGSGRAGCASSSTAINECCCCVRQFVAGYKCAAGTSNVTASPCPPGSYSTAGAVSCTLCVAGQYGATYALTNSNCTGLCPMGTYGATAGLNSSNCSGPCTSGYQCNPGSTTPTPSTCSPGFYSPPSLNSTNCTKCPGLSVC